MRQLAECYPVQIICRVWETPRSSYYYQSQARAQHELRTALQRPAREWPKYGSRRLTTQLRREGYQVNRKHIQRLMQQLEVQDHRSAKKHRTTNIEHPFPRYLNLVERLEVVRPDQVWLCDITYVQLRVECVYLAVLMDVFTRYIRGWHLGCSLDQSLSRLWRTLHQKSIILIKGAVCGDCLRHPLAASRGPDQYGRGRSGLAKWLC